MSRALLEHPAADQPGAAAIPATRLATDANAPLSQTGDLASETIAGRYEPANVGTLNQSVFTPPAEAAERRRASGMKIAIALIVLALIGAAAGLAVWKRDAFFGGRERSVNYSLTVQKMREGKPYQVEFESSGQEIFENGWKFRMNLSSPQDGYLYLLNEGPAGAETTYQMLFPDPQTNNASSRVSANQKLQTAWMRFDDSQGTEKFWIVWAASPVKELEAVTEVVNDRDLGEIKDAARVKAVREFLNAHSSIKPEVTKDAAKRQSAVKGKGEVLVSPIELEHH
jgi:hypothetical protein